MQNRAAATSSQKARVLMALSAFTAASFLGYRKLLIANKTDTTLSSLCSFAQRGVHRVRVMSRSAPKRSL